MKNTQITAFVTTSFVLVALGVYSPVLAAEDDSSVLPLSDIPAELTHKSTCEFAQSLQQELRQPWLNEMMGSCLGDHVSVADAQAQ